jgi:L-lactate dehydrogenase complex protein LldE
MMGRDRIHDHQRAGTEVITAGDMSCLMHLDGLLRRDRTPLRVMHIAEILAGRTIPNEPGALATGSVANAPGSDL